MILQESVVCNVGTAITQHLIQLFALGSGKLGDAIPEHLTRKPDSRTLSDKIYKYRYVIPAVLVLLLLDLQENLL